MYWVTPILTRLSLDRANGVEYVDEHYMREAVQK